MLKRRLSFCFIYLIFAVYAVFIQRTVEVSYLALVFPLVPLTFYILNILNIKLSIIYDYLLATYFLIHGIGELLNYYYRIPNLDMFLHMFAGTISASLVLYYIYYYKMNLSLRVKSIMIFWCSMGFAAIWEMFEFLFDEVAGGDMQKRAEGVIDTMHDIYIHAFGTLLLLVVIIFDNLFNNNKINKVIEKGLFMFDEQKETEEQTV